MWGEVIMRGFPVRLAAIAAVALVSSGPEALANRRACLNTEQHFAQIERYASTVEINIKLFEAAKHGCAELAQRVLDWQPKVPLEEGLERTIAYFETRLQGDH